MLAHYHGRVWNVGVRAFLEGSRITSRGATWMRSKRCSWCGCSEPWAANLKKRQVKSPKVYLRDSGVLHNFLGISTHAELNGIRNSERRGRGS